jgi:hypothetical protein
MDTLALNVHRFAEMNKIRAAQNSAAPKTERTNIKNPSFSRTVRRLGNAALIVR